jgi:hypothetical protein
MHVHGSQLNLNAAVDAAYAAQKAAAARAASETRKKLMEFAAALAGEGDSFVARTGDEDESSRQPSQQNQPKNRKNPRHKSNAPTDPEETGGHLSDWV